ncbi:UNVERIFIED_CONTAM: hypothetical protein PYX00_004352 [Menopon gallinae]|uniref:Zinc-hook domain-containing protein n=1 Tax=Menopon gallinae TaxID=328185 RepID=A0AAW2I3U4_9NEOP
MASLEKIKICGIRSFGPEEEDVQTIKFQKPLTLILGENGCGKSTIIECLRYLTAQKDPAGKGTFVHDPSLTGRTSVKAFVKLQIKDAKGNQIDLCRQVQSTRTKKTLTTKSLDNVITTTMKDTKKKESISNRCADFTYEISRIFGVSKAILENVIFCTQEDSHWPLDTDQKLKEKFDQIFDSDRYNKCVTKVRDKVKKIKELVKVSDVEIKHLENYKKLAAEKKREIENRRRQIKDCEQEIAELTASLRPIDEKLKEINEKEMEISKCVSLKETKKMELKQAEDYITELECRIGAGYDGSDEELKDALTNFSKQLAVRQKEISKLEEKVTDWDRKEGRLSRELMTEQGKLGQLQKEEEINKERQTEREQKLNTLAVQLGIDSDELSHDSEDSVDYLLSRIESEIRSKEGEVKILKQKNAKEESDMQLDIDELRKKSLMAQNDVSNKESGIRNRKSEMAKINRELNEIEMSTSKLSKIEKQLSEANAKIEEIQKKVDTDRLRNEIRSTVNERNEVEDKLTEVEESIKILQQGAAVSAELEIQRELLSGKESDIRRLLNKHRDSLRSILGEEPSSGFRVAVQTQVDKLKRSVKELTSKLTRKERELTELDMKRKHQKEQLRQKEEKLRSIEEEIYEECGSDDFDEVVTALRNQIDELQDMKGILTSSEYMYQKYIKSLQKSQPCCPLCHRDFPRQSEAQDLVEELTTKLEEVPSKLTENKDLLEEKQTKYNKLLTLRSKYDQIVTLKNETIPEMRKEQEAVESSIKKIRKEIDEINVEILPCQTDEAICLSMQGDMALLDQLQVEKKKIKIGDRKTRIQVRKQSRREAGGYVPGAGNPSQEIENTSGDLGGSPREAQPS